ncbi:MAG TPA: tetratricopeptide repeat protein [Nitrospiraceae bacterium]
MNADYSGAELCRILRLSESGLRSCLRAALLPMSRAGTSRRYSFQNLVVLRTAQGLTEAGVSVRQIRKVLESLQRQLGEGQGMSSLKIYASGKRVVVWDGTSHWQPDSGQFLLNFDTTHIVQPTKLQPPLRGQPSQVEAALAWFDRGMTLQDDSMEEARRAYQEAIRVRPAFVEAHVNLGRLHHNAGELKEAEACYRRALQSEPEFALAHFNLAVVLEDQQDKSGALVAYEEALKRAPEFREAHRNVAQLYEQLGRRRDAVRHYAAAKRLDE